MAGQYKVTETANNFVGAAWLKTDKKGSKYLSVVLDKDIAPYKNKRGDYVRNFCLFANKSKKKENDPDYRAVVLPPRPAVGL